MLSTPCNPENEPAQPTFSCPSIPSTCPWNRRPLAKAWSPWLSAGSSASTPPAPMLPPTTVALPAADSFGNAGGSGISWSQLCTTLQHSCVCSGSGQPPKAFESMLHLQVWVALYFGSFGGGQHR